MVQISLGPGTVMDQTSVALGIITAQTLVLPGVIMDLVSVRLAMATVGAGDTWEKIIDMDNDF